MAAIRLFVYGGDWARILADLANTKGDGRISARWVGFPRINPLLLFREVRQADIVLRVGVRPGGIGKRPFVLDIYWQLFRWFWPRKSFVYFWIGTDVLQALEERQSGTTPYFLKLAQTAHHFANAPWLKEELASIGVPSEVVLFPSGKVNPPPAESIAWPERFTVMAYIPDHRHTFYGGEEFLNAARQLPDVRFFVTAGSGAWAKQITGNLHFLGYRDDMAELFNAAHVVVRQVRHDAIGGTVREALFYARHVVYSYPLPHTHLVAWGDSDGIVRTIRRLRDQFNAGLLAPNHAGREYALDEWSPPRLIDALTNQLLTVHATKDHGNNGGSVPSQ
jgi:hypothetical protein